MRLSCKKPAKCLKELHSPEQQYANTHRLHQAVLAYGQARSQRRPRREHRRDFLPPPAGASDRGVKQAQLWGNAKEATTFTVAFSMDHGPLDMLIVQADKTDSVLPEEHTHHVTSEIGWANTTTLLQLMATLDNVLNLSKELQAWT